VFELSGFIVDGVPYPPFDNAAKVVQSSKQNTLEPVDILPTFFGIFLED